MSRVEGELFVPYPRTPHLEGSGLQKGDDARDVLSVSSLRGYRVVLEEKVDASNAGFGFDGAGDPFAQSRGHLLRLDDRSVHRERHFNLLKEWTLVHRGELLDRLEDRYVVYMEWMGATHSIFYDDLPHLAMEFDVWDRSARAFLDTPSRRRLLQGLPLCSVPVLHVTDRFTMKSVTDHLLPSLFRRRRAGTDGTASWVDGLRLACRRSGDDFDRRLPKLYGADMSEGLYGKVEKDGYVVARFKFVCGGFVQTILDADEHWHNRILVPNLLRGRCVSSFFPDAVVRDTALDTAGYDPDAPFGWAPWATAEEFPVLGGIAR